MLSQVGFSAYSQKASNPHDYKYAISFAYFGHNAIHPGLKLEAEFPLWYNSREKQKKNRVKTKYRFLMVGVNSGFYTHASNHTGMFFNITGGYRKISRKTFKFETLIQPGFLRAFNAGETYEVQDDGSVKEIARAGRNYAQFGVSVGIGQSFLPNEFPFAWHIRGGSNLQMPYNTSINIFFTLEAGITWLFKEKQ